MTSLSKPCRLHPEMGSILLHLELRDQNAAEEAAKSHATLAWLLERTNIDGLLQDVLIQERDPVWD